MLHIYCEGFKGAGEDVINELAKELLADSELQEETTVIMRCLHDLSESGIAFINDVDYGVAIVEELKKRGYEVSTQYICSNRRPRKRG